MTTTVTTSVVFTDLVGSTEMTARLGPVVGEEVRTVHFGLLRDAIAATDGREVKNLGDGLMVVYSSLGGALDGAVAIQQGIEHHNRAALERLEVRVGLSSGDATEDGGDYFGEPVVEAARLCAKASGGQILTTDMVRLLARRTDHRFTPFGAHEFKGLPEPVEVCEVWWAPAEAVAQVALPSRLLATPVTGVVGRVLESEHLVATLKAVCTGGGHRVVLLSGEPGIGKTTLACDLAQRAHRDGATVLYGRCDEDLGVPYQPFVEAVGGYFANVAERSLAALDGPRLSQLSRLLPQIRDRIPALPEPPSTDGDVERYLLFGAITATLSEISTTSPVVLVLDDLHWADKSTVLLLRHLVATLDRASVLVIGTYRVSDLTTMRPLTDGLAALRREPSVERVAVGGLDDSGVVALLEGFAGHEMDGHGIELAHAVRRETDGNPFFTAEILRHLTETAAIRREEGRWVAAVEVSSIGLPESVREVVRQRVRRLGDDVQQVLTVASVIGRDFALGLVARVAERDEGRVLAALEEAASAGVVAEVDGRPERFTFAHALFQHTLYDELSASRRARTHRRIGELLEAECGDDPGARIGELAHHWMMAATSSPEAGRAAGYARQAGARALAALAPDEAIRWFRQAVELLDAGSSWDPLLRLDVLIGLGDAQRQAGDPEYRETLLDAASEATRLGDADRLVAAALANHRGTVSNVGAVDPDRIAMLEKALAAAGEADTQARAWLLASLAAELPFSRDLDRVRGLAAEAERIARRMADDVALLRVHNLTFSPLWVPDALARTVAASKEALTLAGRVRDPVAQFWAALNRVFAMSSSADRDGIDSALDLAVSLAQEIGQPFLTWWALQVRCPHVLLTGDVDEAERLANEVLEIGMDSGQPDALVVFGASLAGIRWHQGRVDEILPLIEQAAADNPGIPAFQAAYAVMLCECGRVDEARSLLAAAHRHDFHHAAYDWIWLTTTTVWADAVVWVGDRSAAAVLYERLSPFEAQGVFTGSTFNGTVGVYLARLATVLDRHDEALRLFERADTQLRSLRAPFWRARNQVDWARQLSTQGTDASLRRAGELVSEASGMAEAYGCRAVLRRAEELAESLP